MMATVAQAKRQATIDVLARAAQQVMIERGLDFTMDDVADMAQVSRSTLFRHFATRDDLIVVAATSGRDDYVARMPVYQGQDWRAWLHELCTIVHEANGMAGKALLLVTGADALPDRLRSVGRDLDESRRRRYPGIAQTLWRAARRDGPVPDHVIMIVAIHLSPLFTEAVRHEAGADVATAARLAERAIADAVGAKLISE